MTTTSALGLGFRVYGLELRLRERLCNSPNTVWSHTVDVGLFWKEDKALLI